MLKNCFFFCECISKYIFFWKSLVFFLVRFKLDFSLWKTWNWISKYFKFPTQIVTKFTKKKTLWNFSQKASKVSKNFKWNPKFERENLESESLSFLFRLLKLVQSNHFNSSHQRRRLSSSSPKFLWMFYQVFLVQSPEKKPTKKMSLINLLVRSFRLSLWEVRTRSRIRQLSPITKTIVSTHQDLQDVQDPSTLLVQVQC